MSTGEPEGLLKEEIHTYVDNILNAVFVWVLLSLHLILLFKMMKRKVELSLLISFQETR